MNIITIISINQRLTSAASDADNATSRIDCSATATDDVVNK